MLAILFGDISLILGFVVLLLPLLATELSRPRDSFWGAVLLLLGLVLITSDDRLRGAPMLAVVAGGLVIGRLGIEVAQSRWVQLGQEEKKRFGSLERWTTSFVQLRFVVENVAAAFGSLVKAFGPKSKPSSIGKKWVRPEEPTFEEPSTDSGLQLTNVSTNSLQDTGPILQTLSEKDSPPKDS